MRRARKVTPSFLLLLPEENKSGLPCWSLFTLYKVIYSVIINTTFLLDNCLVGCVPIEPCASDLGRRARAKSVSLVRVFSRARVFFLARVFSFVRVFFRARVFSFVRVISRARVFSFVRVFSRARVFSFVRVISRARVFSFVRVISRARVFSFVRVFSRARVYSRARFLLAFSPSASYAA